MILRGLHFDEFNPEDLNKRDYGTIKEKGKHQEFFLWLETYKRDFKNNVYELESHLLTKTSRGTVFFDGERLKDPKDIDLGSKLFSSLDFGKI